MAVRFLVAWVIFTPSLCDSSEDCFMEGASYTPLDMPGTQLTVEANATACQARCRNVTNCTHFIFWRPRGHCHLQDESALLNAHAVEFVAGPRECLDTGCLEPSVAYTPVMEPTGFYRHRPQGAAISACKDLCHSVDGCAHFVLTMPEKTCHLARADATRVSRAYGKVAGPPVCNLSAVAAANAEGAAEEEAEASELQEKFKAPAVRAARQHVSLGTAGAIAGVASVICAAGVACGLASAGRRFRAAGVRGVHTSPGLGYASAPLSADAAAEGEGQGEHCGLAA